MIEVQLGDWLLKYELISRPPTEEGEALQFGMRYVLTLTATEARFRSLIQLIYPATSVLRNVAGQWNVDSIAFHNEPHELAKSIFKDGGLESKIEDSPTEIVIVGDDNDWSVSTDISVFRADLSDHSIRTKGVGFGYRAALDGAGAVEVSFSGIKAYDMSPEQKALFGSVKGLSFI